MLTKTLFASLKPVFTQLDEVYVPIEITIETKALYKNLMLTDSYFDFDKIEVLYFHVPSLLKFILTETQSVVLPAIEEYLA